MKSVIFEKIQITNFKNHDFAEISFVPNRLISITGPNGSGKSALAADAICVALYDQTTKGIKGDGYVKKRTDKDCSVILHFSVENDRYVIKNYRKHSTHGNSKHMFKIVDENTIEDITKSTRNDTNSFISSLIMPFDVFCNCILFSQFVDKPFAGLGHSGQKDILDKMLCLEKYDHYYKQTSEILKNTEESITTEKANISLNKSLIEKNNLKISSLNDNIKEICEKIEDTKISYKNTINQLTSRLLGEEEQISKHENLLKRYEEIKDNLVNEMSIYRENEIELKNQLEKLSLKEKDKVSQCLSELEKAYSVRNSENDNSIISYENKLQNINESFAAKFSDYKSSLVDSISKNRELISNDINQLKESSSEFKLSLNNLVREKETLEKERISSTDRFEVIKKIVKEDIPYCPECGQKINDEDKLKTLKQEGNDLFKKINDINNKINEINSEINEITLKNENIKSDLDTKTKQYEKEESYLKEKLESFRNELKIEFEKSSKDIKENLQKFKNISEDLKVELNREIDLMKKSVSEEFINESKSINESFHIKLNDIKLKCESLQKDKVHIEGNMKQMETLLDTYKDIHLRIDNEKYQFETTNKMLSERLHEKQVEENELVNDTNTLQQVVSVKDSKIKEFTDKIDILNFWKEAFGDQGIKSVLLDESIPILNVKARELCTLLDNIKISFNSQSMLKSGDIRNKFSINVIQTENLSDYSELSAGETRISNIIVLLCLRHLLEVMNGCKINILILDEILDSIDADNSKIILNVFKKLSEDHCIVMISHVLREYIEFDDEYCL